MDSNNEESIFDSSGLPSLSPSEPIEAMMESGETSDPVIAGTWFKNNIPSRSTSTSGAASTSNKKRSRKEGDSSEDIELQLQSTEQKVKKPRKISSSNINFPTNKTLNTMGRDITVLIKQNDDQKKMTLDPVGIARGFKELNFHTVKDIRMNKLRNIIAIDFTETNNSEMKKMLEVQKLGKYKVLCNKPSSEIKYISGVIGPVDLDVDLEELRELANAEGNKILKMTRLPKFSRGKKEASQMIRVDYTETSLPDKLTLCYMSYPVMTYYPPPIRCYNCQRLGHMANGCTALKRCLVCGGNHDKSECNASCPKCPNCGGSHVASSGECSFIKNYKAIQKESLNNGISFGEARKRVIASQTDTLSQDTFYSVSQQDNSETPDQYTPVNESQSQKNLKNYTTTAEVHQSQGSYYLQRRYKPPNISDGSFANILKQNIPVKASNPQIENLPQVDPSIDILKDCKKYIDEAVHTMCTKLISLLQEVFSFKLQEEQKRERELVLISMARNHFGSSVGEALLARLHAEDALSSHSKEARAGTALPSASVPKANLTKNHINVVNQNLNKKQNPPTTGTKPKNIFSKQPKKTPIRNNNA